MSSQTSKLLVWIDYLVTLFYVKKKIEMYSYMTFKMKMISVYLHPRIHNLHWLIKNTPILEYRHECEPVGLVLITTFHDAAIIFNNMKGAQLIWNLSLITSWVYVWTLQPQFTSKEDLKLIYTILCTEAQIEPFMSMGINIYCYPVVTLHFQNNIN